MIELVGITKRFGPVVAVENLSFFVDKGEVLGFLGPNGAGKTTTMRILTGYFPPTSGTARIAGHDVVDEPMAARRALGYMPEHVPIYPEMRVGEYLQFVGEVKGLARHEARREAARVMEMLGLAERKGQLLKQLSKGYRQRVGMAQAMVADPPVLILDEPTIGLDPGQIVEIRSLIRSMAGSKTIVLSTHILPEVAATCTRVVIINKGRLVAEGSPEILQAAEVGRVRVVCTGEREAIERALRDVKGVEGVSCEGASALAEGAMIFVVATTGGLEVRGALARAVMEAGGQLVELKGVAASLEEVFVQLVTEEPAVSEGEAA